MADLEIVDEPHLLRELLGRYLPVDAGALPAALRETKAKDLILRDLEDADEVDAVPSLIDSPTSRRDTQS